MQHGFASRNGLLGATLAKGGYVGIKKVYEREYVGFLNMFSRGNGKDPRFLIHELTKGLREKWQT
jgi:aconitate decarboxylase